MKFQEAIQKISDKIELTVYGDNPPQDIQSIVKIAAEVLLLNDKDIITINKQNLTGEAIKSVFDGIELEDVELTAKILDGRTDIKYVKAFVRSTLYNSIMERGLK